MVHNDSLRSSIPNKWRQSPHLSISSLSAKKAKSQKFENDKNQASVNLVSIKKNSVKQKITKYLNFKSQSETCACA